MIGTNPNDVAEAARRLSNVVNRTPVLTSRTLNEQTGCKVFLKCENFQRVGAFKFRGAYNAISQLNEQQRVAGVITHSSGNHAQGVALAARLLGVKSIVVMPEDAPRIKREATINYGADVVPCKAIKREVVTTRLITEHGYTLIHPYDNDHIIAGQGTAAWELFDEIGDLDWLFVPVGGGGLISGCALAAAALSPSCRVIGVEPELAADANLSWREGKIVTLDEVPNTIADGLRPRRIGDRNFVIMRNYVSDMTTVTEEEIVNALKFIWQRLKILVEPSAAVALSPLLSGRFQAKGKRIGVILSGGNIDIFSLPNALVDSQESKTTLSESSNFDSVKKDRPRVIVTTPIDSASMDQLRKVAIVESIMAHSADELLPKIHNYHGLVVDEHTAVNSQIIEYGYRLKAIASTGTKLDNIDVSAARSLGIDLFYSPGIDAVDAAEFTVGLMLRLVERYETDCLGSAGQRLSGKTLGLVGFGRIGRLVAQRAAAFEMRVIVNQPRLTPELAIEAGVEITDLSFLLQESDFVSLHVPLTSETKYLIGSEELGQMKRCAFLINTNHYQLIDPEALLKALNHSQVAGAAFPLADDHDHFKTNSFAESLLDHPRVLWVNQLEQPPGAPSREHPIKLIAKFTDSLLKKRPTDSFSLNVIPVNEVIPHEQVDEKRVIRLIEGFNKSGLLINPPIVTHWQGKYIVLDGATRVTALKRLGFPYVIAQVVSPTDGEFTLHTWYHIVSSDYSLPELFEHLSEIEGLSFEPLEAVQIPTIFRQRKNALNYLIDRNGQTTVTFASSVIDPLEVMNAMVDRYSSWGEVERTLISDVSRLLGQYPKFRAVVIFPQYKAETIFDIISKGGRLPAGLTRFVIPGRLLRLNADLARLKQPEPLAVKRAWLDQLLEDRLAHSRLRYYQEPVVLLDD